MSLLDSFANLIFPPRCVNCGRVGAYFCLNCFKAIKWVEQPICAYCKRNALAGFTHPYCRQKYGLDGLSSAFYFTGPIKKAVHQLKYQFITNLEEEITLLMLTSFRKQGVKQAGFEIVPIPLFTAKAHERGFNQAQLLARRLAADWDLELNEQLLKRTKNTKSQANLHLQDRVNNLQSAFEIQGNVADKKLVLMDDVFTTGATFFSAAQVLKKAGASKVWGVSLARSQNL